MPTTTRPLAAAACAAQGPGPCAGPEEVPAACAALIVNRINALEELLGADYPGFYEDPTDADALASSWDAVYAMHAHLARIDVAPLQLERFVRGIEARLADALGR